jgi:hypothetical protein
MTEAGDKREEEMGEKDPNRRESVPPPVEPPAPAEGKATFRCDLCGAPMLDRHCKLLCLGCGYQRDCSDP